MKTIYFFKIIRWPNLVIIAFTMVLMRYCLLQPLLETNGLYLLLTHFKFALLVLSTVMLAAAGYIVNDLNDIDTDSVNKPDKVIAGKFLSIKFLDNIYLVINFSAIAIGVYISYSIGLRSVSVAFLLVAGLLYFYSTTYKRQLFIGNLMVAFFAAIVPIMVFLFEVPLLREKFKVFISARFNFNDIIIWFGFYAFFAFIISLVREIVKDIEDFEGDSAYGKNTIPIAYSTNFARIITAILLSILLAVITYCTVKYLNDPFSITYILPLIIAPIGYVVYLLFKAEEKIHYSKVSQWCKYIMVSGILYTLVIKFVLLNPDLHL